jgi:hypothetical protein
MAFKSKTLPSLSSLAQVTAKSLSRRFENRTTKGETGTGLGLWVTEEIVRRNGWKIRVRSSQARGRWGNDIFPPHVVPQRKPKPKLSAR